MVDVRGATKTDERLAAIRAFPVVIVQRLLPGFLPFSSVVEPVWFHVKLGVCGAARTYRNPIRNRGKMRPMCPMRQGDVSHYVVGRYLWG